MLRRSVTAMPGSRQGTPGPNGSSTNLATLLEQSKRFTNLDSTDLPRLQLGLDQIENQSRKLVARASRASEGIDTRA